MKTDDFEQRLCQQPLRQIPAAWRDQILVAADVNRRNRPTREFTCAAATFRSLLSTLNHQLSTLLWPNPKAWAGLAAVWVVILAMNFTTRDESKTAAKKSPPPSPQVLMALQQQKRLLTELIGQLATPEAEPPLPFLPRPRSERRDEMLTA